MFISVDDNEFDYKFLCMTKHVISRHIRQQKECIEDGDFKMAENYSMMASGAYELWMTFCSISSYLAHKECLRELVDSNRKTEYIFKK